MKFRLRNRRSLIILIAFLAFFFIFRDYLYYTSRELEIIERTRTDLKDKVSSLSKDDKFTKSYYSGNGLVMVGATKYLNSTVQYLTYMYKSLMVVEETEIWYSGNDLDSLSINMMEGVDPKIKCKQLNLVFDPSHQELEKPFHLKQMAIIQSKFESVLFLDSDNLLLRKPTFAFESKEFTLSGLVIWSDFYLKKFFSPIYRTAGLPFRFEYERESGQLLINKTIHGKTLELSLFLTLQPEIQRNRFMLYGDKDTFELAARLLQLPTSVIPYNVLPVGEYHESRKLVCGYALMQKYFDGVPFFIHASFKKIHSCAPLEYYSEPYAHFYGITWNPDWCIRFKSGSIDKKLSETWPDIFTQAYTNLTSSCLYF